MEDDVTSTAVEICEDENVSGRYFESWVWNTRGVVEMVEDELSSVDA